jgi:uncharacterized phage protein gp47/JayE
MPPTFKSEEEVYTDLKTAVQADIPEITNWSPGSVTRAFLMVIAAAIRLLYVVLQSLYFNMFPQDADRESLKRYYDLWGMSWDNPDTDTARKTVLNKYRETAVIGTKPWYEGTMLAQFDSVVNQAVCYPNYRGPGTADLVVMRNNRPIYSADLTTIRDYFNQDSNKVVGMDLLIRTTQVDDDAE